MRQIFPWNIPMIATVALFSNIHETVLRAGSVEFETIAYQGDPAPGLAAGVVFGQLSLSYPMIDTNGAIGFAAVLTGTASGEKSYWQKTASSCQMLVREGDPAPGTPSGITLNCDGFGQFSAGGQFWVHSQVSGAGVMSTNNEGEWFSSPGGLRLLARTGDPAPGFNDGTSIESVDDSWWSASSNVACRVWLTGEHVEGTNDVVLLAGPPGTPRRVARAGDRAPGTHNGTYFSGFGTRAISPSGAVLFDGYLVGDDVVYENQRAVWLSTMNETRLVVRTGDAVPGFPGAVFTAFSGWSLTPVGAVYLNARARQTATDTYDNAIWSGFPDAPKRILGTGDAAPGLPAGVTVAAVGLLARGSDGVLAVTGTLSGPGINDTNRYCFWKGLPGQFRLVAQAGDPAPGTAPGIFFKNLASPCWLNNRGTFVFRATLAGPDVTSENENGLWAVTDGQPFLILREGMPFRVHGTDLKQIYGYGIGLYTGGGPTKNPIEDGGVMVFNDDGILVSCLRFTDNTAAIVAITIPQGAVPARPTLTARQSANQIHLTLASQADVTYQLQTAIQLGLGASWADDGAPQSGNGSTLTFTRPVNSTNRFYRVAVNWR